MRSTSLLALPLVCGLALPALSAQAQVLLAEGDLAGWEPITVDDIPRHTQYSVVADAEQGAVLEGVADSAAAGFSYNKSLELGPDSVLRVVYQVAEATNSASETTKAGDDFPLRLYVTSRSLLVYRTLVLVRSIQQPAGAAWTSPYDGAIARFEMRAFAGQEQELGQWYTAEIPVGRLWQEAFGTEPGTIEGIGMMVDSDNAGGRMRTRIALIEYDA